MTSTGTTADPPAFLSRGTAIAVAFASVVGSGVVVIPAAVAAASGPGALIAWIVTAALCLPMIALFRDTVLRSPGVRDPLRAGVERGLGPAAGRMVPLCFVLVVPLGLPSNAVAAAHLLSAALGVPVPPVPTAAAVLGLAVAVNLLGGRTSARVQLLAGGALILVVLGAGIATLTAPAQPSAALPDLGSWQLAPAGMLLAFWAFVGFENLTFIARDLREPRRDFTLVAMIALGLLLGLALLLTVVALSGPGTPDPLTGVVEAVRRGPGGGAMAVIVAAAGAGGVLLNALAWVRGCALVLDAAASEGIVPRRLASHDPGAPAGARSASWRWASRPH